VHEALGSPGEPLADSHRASFEAQLGADLHGVRVHTNPLADVSARAVGALAYTVGRHLVFRRGAYAPDSTEGRRLLAHELAHVVQQQGTASSPAAQLEIGSVDDPAEREAQRFADAAVASPAYSNEAMDAGAAAPQRSRESSLRQSLRRDILARYAHQDCTQDDLENHVWPADYLARQMVKKAITALSASPVDPSVAALFPKYFMTTTPNIAAILNVFNKVNAAFAANDYTYECEESCKANWEAYTWSGLVGALTSAHIHLCAGYYRHCSNEDLAHAIVHEFTHRYASLSGDPAICNSWPCGTAAACPSSLTPADALKNADSYGAFAQDLWGLSIAPPPPLPAPPSSPPTTGDGGTGDGGTGDGGTGDGGTGDGGP
jgi:hypothetical protein